MLTKGSIKSIRFSGIFIYDPLDLLTPLSKPALFHIPSWTVMDEIEVRVLLNALDSAHNMLICMRLEADRCKIGGHLVSAYKIATHLEAPIAVEAVQMSNGRLTCIGDTLLIKNPRGVEIARREVAGIDLSHTDLLTDVHRSSCVAEAHDDPADNWALILSSGPIWCFHFAKDAPALL